MRQTQTASASSATQRLTQPRRATGGGPLDLASITTICRAAGNQDDPAGFIARLSTAYSLSADDSTSRADYFDANLTRPIPNGVATIDPTSGGTITNHFVLAGVGADTIDPDAKLSYISEYQIGI